jgi:hypothetical protein
MVAISGVVNCYSYAPWSGRVNGSWQLQQANDLMGDCNHWCYWFYEDVYRKIELLFDLEHCHSDEDYPYMILNAMVYGDPPYEHQLFDGYFYHSLSEVGHGCDEWRCRNDVPNQNYCVPSMITAYGGIASWRPGIISCWEIGKNYVVGNQIVGTNCQVYICILNHLSTSSNRPITGESWSIYWAFYSA